MNPMKSMTTYSIALIFSLCFFVNAQEDIWQQTFGPETGIANSFARNTSGLIFVGTNDGFIFRSDNDGQTWRVLNSGGAPKRIECLLIPDGNTIYAGTSGSGIHKSTDNGDTWTDISDETIGMHGWTIRALGINSSGDILIGAGGELGIYKSVDGGQSWTQVANGLMLNSASRVEGFALSNGGVVYTSIYNSGVYMSSDNGDNWNSIGDNLPDLQNLYDIIYTDNSNLFVAIDGHGVYRTSDNGTNWEDVSNEMINLNTTVLTVAPDGDILCGNYGADVFLSTNEGDNWSKIDQNIMTARIDALLAFGDNDLLVGTLGQGIFRSTNDGITWYVANDGFINSEIYDLEIDNAGILYAATRDMVFNTDDDGITWEHKEAGLPSTLIYDLAIHEGNNSIFAATSWGLARSTDGGESWVTLMGNIPDNATYNSVAVNTNNGYIFVARAGYGVYRSINNGDDWVEVNSGLSFEANTRGLEIAIDNNGTIYMATYDHYTPQGIYRSDNNGNSWVQVNNGLVSLNSRCIAINNEDILFTGFGDEGIFRSVDGGNNWEQIFSSGYKYVETITFNSLGHIFAGTISGVMRSINGGETWHNFDAGFPEYPDNYIPALRADNMDYLYAGTQGAGVYKTTKATTLSNPTLSLPENNAGAEPVSLNLSWENVAGAGEYELQISTTSDFSINEVNQKGITETSWEITNLSHETKYFWRVRAWDNFAVSNWSDAYIFITFKEGPVLTDPANNSVDVNTDVTFSWNALSGAEDYEIQVAAAFDFSTIERSLNNLTSPNVLIEDLGNEKTYYWRVRANFPEGPSDWSQVFTFNTIRSGPDLIYPPDNDTNISVHINFSWSGISSAISYQLQVSTDAQFTGSEFNIDNINDTKYEETAFAHSQQYFWRVRAHFDDGSSAWSVTRTFTTLRAGPVLSSPDNNETGVNRDVNFYWNSVASAIEYHAQVSTDISFSSPEYDSGQLASTTYYLQNLAYSNTYYWHVRAYFNDGTYSDWSEIRSFTTILAPINLTGPEDDITNVAFPITFYWDGDPNATSYWPQLSENNVFNPIAFSKNDITSTSHEIENLAFDRQYFWRVAGLDNGSQGGWSEIRSFTTQKYPSSIDANTYIDFPMHEKPREFSATDYRLFGLPGTSELYLNQVFGEGSGEQWIAYYDDYDGGNSTNIFIKHTPDDGRFRFYQGLGFWILNKGRLEVNMNVTSALLNDQNQAHITLHDGWNIITNPFPNTVPWQAVRELNGLGGLPLYTYNGSFNTTDMMEPYLGYYIDNPSGYSDLFVPYTASLPKAAMIESETNWRLDIILNSGEFEDAATWLGVSDHAQPEIDDFDYRKPRAIGSVPRVYFNRSEWGEKWSSLTSDIRLAIEDKEIWDFDVESPAGQEAQLSFIDVAELPANFDIYLIDKNKLKTIDLRLENEYTFKPVTDHSKFAIIVGVESAIEEELRLIVPAEFILGNNYPNPFNPETVIPVELPEAGEISLKIYNLLGEEISTLYQGSLETGRHLFKWNGTNQAGQRCPSGIYLYQVEGNQGFKASNRMIMIK